MHLPYVRAKKTIKGQMLSDEKDQMPNLVCLAPPTLQEFQMIVDQSVKNYPAVPFVLICPPQNVEWISYVQRKYDEVILFFYFFYFLIFY